MSESDWLACDCARNRLAALTPVLESLGETSDHRLSLLLNSIVRSPGKRLRPAMLLVAAGETCSAEQALRYAAAVELVHIASLHHDDVIDRADRRRGVISCNARWGNELATWSGTILSMRAARIFALGGDSINRVATTELAHLGLGQMHEAIDSYNYNLDIKDHLMTLELKTASLFRLACRLGASLGRRNNSEHERLQDFATSFGVAFQLLDDIEDLRQAYYFDGKTAARDLKEGVYSLAVLLAAQGQDTNAQQIRTVLDRSETRDESFHHALELIRKSGAIEAALQLAHEFIIQARAPLHTLQANSMRTSLLQLLAHLDARCHV